MVTALCVSVALLVAVSVMVPELSPSESAVMARPSASLSPETTVYENTSVDVPDPDVYVANLLVSPASATRGVPVTVTFSEKVTATVMVSPIL